MSRESESRFTATVRIAGINPYVEVPARCVDALARGHRWKVLVKFARAGSKETRSRSSTRASISKDAARLRELGRLSPGGWFRTTIVPSRSGAPRLYVDQWMRKVASLSVGDRALVALRPDRKHAYSRDARHAPGSACSRSSGEGSLAGPSAFATARDLVVSQLSEDPSGARPECAEDDYDAPWCG